jgi:tetratricopeptide (TPR) repeat protein
VSGSTVPCLALAGENGAANEPNSPVPQVDPEARRLYEEALAHFTNGELDKAIANLEAAYRIAPAAELLYNLGQAYRRTGDCRKALDFYRRFLDSDPAGIARERAQARVSDMEACVNSESARAEHEVNRAVGEDSPALRPGTMTQATPKLIALPAPLVVVHPNAGAQPAKPLANVPSWWRRHRLSLIASVSAMLLASASGYLAWRSHQASERMSGVFERGDTWTPADTDNENSGRWQGRAAIGTGALGLATGAIAAWSFWRD